MICYSDGLYFSFQPQASVRRSRKARPKTAHVYWYVIHVSLCFASADQRGRTMRFIFLEVPFSRNIIPWFCCICRPTMYSMIFNVVTRKHFQKEENQGKPKQETEYPRNLTPLCIYFRLNIVLLCTPQLAVLAPSFLNLRQRVLGYLFCSVSAEEVLPLIGAII